jgi:hypothetical protein
MGITNRELSGGPRDPAATEQASLGIVFSFMDLIVGVIVCLIVMASIWSAIYAMAMHLPIVGRNITGWPAVIASAFFGASTWKYLWGRHEWEAAEVAVVTLILLGLARLKLYEYLKKTD